MRGGTSTGIVLWAEHLRPFEQFRDVIIRKIMGVPDEGESKGNLQITGLGRGPSTSNKVTSDLFVGTLRARIFVADNVFNWLVADIPFSGDDC